MKKCARDMWRNCIGIFFNIFLSNESINGVEIGIGGGQATPPVVKTGCKLTAVEYGEALSEICREKFKEYPRFSVATLKI